MAKYFASKATTQFIKVGEILHFTEDPFLLSSKNSSVLKADTLEKAWKIVEPLLNGSVELRNVSSKNEIYSYSNRATTWLKDKNKIEITIREFQKKGPRPRKRVEEIKRIFGILEDHNYLKFDRANNKYIVNPKFLT